MKTPLNIIKLIIADLLLYVFLRTHRLYVTICII